MKFLLYSLTSLLLLSSLSFTAIHNVPQDFTTIQPAIDFASDGDTIYVYPGTYTGFGNVDLSFNGKNLYLKGYSGSSQTFINCNGSESDPHIAFFFDNDEDSRSIIDGFTIYNAYDTGFTAALKFLHGSAQIQNCVIENNSVSGIVFSNYSSPGTVVNCIIRNNTYGFGHTGSFTTIRECNISQNTYSGVVSRGGLFVESSVIADNGSFGIFNANGVSQSVVIDHCTIVNNNIGIHYEEELPKSSDTESVLSVNFSIIAFNQTTGVEVIMSDAIGECNVTYANPAGSWIGVDTSQLSAFGNIEADPKFCDTATQNYFLQFDSPARPDYNNCVASIGALGQSDCHCCRGIRANIDFDPNDQIDISDLVWFVLYMFTGGPGPYCFDEADINADGSWDIDDLIYLVNYMFTPGSPAPHPCPNY